MFILHECIIEEVSDDGTSDSPAPAKSSSKDSKKENGPGPIAVSLTFKITNKVSYKTIIKGVYYFGVQVNSSFLFS